MLDRLRHPFHSSGVRKNAGQSAAEEAPQKPVPSPATASRRPKAGKILKAIVHPRSEVQRVQSSGDSPLDDRLRGLQRLRFLHAVDNPLRLRYFIRNPKYSAIDLDLRFDPKTQQVVVSHAPLSRPRLSRRMPLAEVLATLRDLPPEKVGAVKLDIKERAVIKPLMDVLKTSVPNGWWQRRELILNTGIPGPCRPDNDKYICLDDLHDMKREFPDAILSLGMDHLTPERLAALERTLPKLDGVKTLAVHITSPVEAGFVQRIMAEYNTYLTIWADSAHRLIRGFQKPQVAAEEKDRICWDW